MTTRETRPPARLHVILASNSPLAVVFRRGPTNKVCTFLWDRTNDDFTQGQWLKGRIYERRSDISPDGKYLLCFAMNGRRKSETGGTWTAISKAPWLKAIELYAVGDTWNGGGQFLSNNSYWLNGSHSNPLRVSQEVNCDTSYQPEAGHNATLNGPKFTFGNMGMYRRHLIRDGWELIENDEKNGAIFKKYLHKGWRIQKIIYGAKSGEKHILFNEYSDIELQHDDWEWADSDQDYIVWASKGCLYRSKIINDKQLEEPELIHNFNDYQYEEILAPY